MQSLSRGILKINSLLISCLPFFLIVGPAPSDIALSIVALLYLVYSVVNREIDQLKNKFVIIFFIFYFYLIFTSLLSENIYLSFQSSLFYFRYLPFVLCIIFLINNDPYFKNKVFYGFLFSFIILIVDAYFQYFIGYNFLGYEYDGIRLSGFFDEEKKLGSYLSRLSPIFIGISIYLFGHSKFKIISLLLLIILVDILVVLSGERTSIFYMTMSTFLITILISKWKIYRILAFSISIFVSLIIILNNENVKERVYTKTVEQTNLMGQKMNTFSIQHQVIYSTALKIFVDYPFFGIGPKNFREKCKLEKYKTYTEEDQSVDGCQTHPHNTYIQLLTETGIFGFLFVLFIFVYLNYLLLKHVIIFLLNKKFFLKDIEICMIVSIYVTLWPFAPTGNFFNNWLNVIYFLPIGFFLYEKYR